MHKLNYSTANEQARTSDLMRIVPRNRETLLDVGARDGHISKLLAPAFKQVCSLDLECPEFDTESLPITRVAGNACHLDFPDRSFDVVVCVEVLEHIPDLEKACSELKRVARHEIVIGVPFQQDIRVGRVTCQACGRTNPPWGHVNSFDEERLRSLFAPFRVQSVSFVGQTRDSTNALAVWLMDRGGNPWGSYSRVEPCIHCGAKLVAPVNRSIWQRACSGLGFYLRKLQRSVARPHATWVHMVFSRD